MTFLDGSWTPIPHRTDSIPATQIGMGILSYLKYHELRGKQDGAYLSTACSMGDYLVKESLTPKSGRYPAFTRSTGNCEKFPQPADAGAQADRPFEIEPDKGGIAGYACSSFTPSAGANTWSRGCKMPASLPAISRTAMHSVRRGPFAPIIAAAKAADPSQET
jgi:hypothetical protein